MITATTQKSFCVGVQVQSTETGGVYGMKGLIDCSAEGLFMDIMYVKDNKIPMHALQHLISVNNVDGSPNEHGLIHKTGSTDSFPFRFCTEVDMSSPMAKK
jgi:hypothetical protein